MKAFVVLSKSQPDYHYHKHLQEQTGQIPFIFSHIDFGLAVTAPVNCFC
jgi:hypothetical protein